MEHDFDLENELMDEESYYNEIRGGYSTDHEGQHSNSLYGVEDEESAAMNNYVEELLQLEKESEMKKNAGGEILNGNDNTPLLISSPLEKTLQLPTSSTPFGMKPPDENFVKSHQKSSQPPAHVASSSSTSTFHFSSSGRAGAGGGGGGYVTQLPSFTSASSESKKFLKDRPALGDDCQSVTLPNGKRKYIYYRRDSSLKAAVSEREALLSKPIEEILREAERKKIASLAALEGNVPEGSRELFSGEDSYSQQRQQLWVDKYAPKSFSQLLSPEKLNREVLRAIKMWDQYVFDRDITHLTPKAENHFSGESNKNDFHLAEEELIHQSDQHRKDKRPFFKVLLLTGPPGTGKTTLAHIVANHCGYRAIEMNASDDRSIDALKDIISRSMANNTLNSFTESRENRPNCVILDEIDGMDGRGPIDALVSIIKTPLQFNDSSGGKKKSLKGRIALTRPLICICNDQYSPILKELRAVAKVFPFSAPTEIRLVQRLKAICQQEHLGNLSTTALTALCQSCNLDIRSAINTLQFAAMKCSQLHNSTHNSSTANTQQPQHGKKEKIGTDYSYEVSHILTSMLLSGSKDERQDVFKLWRNIFTIRDHQSATKRLSLLSAVQHSSQVTDKAVTGAGGPGGGGRGSTQEQRLVSRNSQTYRSSNAMEIFENVSSFSDNPLVLSGVHENYLSIRYTDPTAQRTALAADWLSIGDLFEGKLYSGENNSHATAAYLPTVVSAIHLICATDSKVQKLQFPSQDRSNYFLKSQRENILRNFCDGCVGNAQSASSRQTCALDIIPLLMEILSLSGAINVRSGALHILTPREVDRIKEVAATMASHGLQYERQNHSRSESGESTTAFHLEPAIDLFASYDFGEIEKKRPQLSNETKLNLFLETRALLLQQQQQAHGPPSAVASASDSREISSAPRQESKGTKRAPEATLPQESLSSVSGMPAKKTKVNGSLAFFAKAKNPPTAAVSVTNESGVDAEKRKVKGAPVVKFKFNQGFTNAVKRPVKISEFLSS